MERITVSIRLRLKWRHTWPEGGDDFVALSHLDPAKTVCRIYLSNSLPTHITTRWYWACNGAYKTLYGYQNGLAATAREAAKAGEDEWFAMVERGDRAAAER